MNARYRKPAAPRARISFAAVLVVLQFAVVSVILLMGQVDWKATMATAPQPVGSAEASQPADYAADIAGEMAHGDAEPPALPVSVSVTVERVVPVGTAAAEAASVAMPRDPAPAPLAVVAAEAAAATPMRSVRLEPAKDVAAPTTQDRMIAVDKSGIPLPPPVD